MSSDDILSRRIKQFYLAMTNRCNLRCRMCTTTTHLHELESELSLQDWQSIIHNILRFNVETVGFGGGEPLMREHDLVSLTRMVAGRGVTVNIVTNATLVTADFIGRLSDLKEKIVFLFSLDGLERENDLIRGTGVFEKVVAAARLMQAKNWPFIFTSVLMPENFSSFCDFLGFIGREFPEAHVDIQPVIAHNEVYHLRKGFALTPQQTSDLQTTVEWIKAHADKMKLCRPLGVIEKYPDYFAGTLVADNRCRMGTESFNINLRGNFWVCGKEIDRPLHRYRVEEVLDSIQYQQELARIHVCTSPCLAGLVI